MNYKGSNTAQNEKPQVKVATETQGKAVMKCNGSSTTDKELQESKTRYQKGLELYKQGRVNISSASGYFIVDGYQVDPEKITCECPDYRKNEIPCAHFYAASLFQKNRGKSGKIEHLQLEEFPKGNDSTNSPQDSPNRENKARGEALDRKQGIITRLACINSAIEIFRVNEDVIGVKELLSIAKQLEDWTLGIEGNL